MFLAGKFLVYAFSAMLVGLMGCIMALGFQLHAARKAGEADIFNFALHEFLAKKCFWLAIAITITVEGLLTMKYGFHRPHIPGFATHLYGGVVPFGILLPVCVFWITGNNKKLGRWHRRIVYPCYGVAILMAITGDLLVHRL